MVRLFTILLMASVVTLAGCKKSEAPKPAPVVTPAPVKAEAPAPSPFLRKISQQLNRLELRVKSLELLAQKYKPSGQ